MYRTLVILRHTFREAIVQPIYLLLLFLGAAILAVYALLPFFTLGEDTVMFKAVGLDVVLLLTLIATLFATSRSIFDEIEDRTMLTLMSKPVKKWEVLVGKYLGIILSAAMMIALLGLVLMLCTWARVPTDYQFNAASLDDREILVLRDHRMMNIVGLFPSLLLMWMQVGVLAAISVAISTRLPLVVNLPAVILLYLAGNLAQFLPLSSGSLLERGVSQVIATVIPFLANFDLRSKTVYAHAALKGSIFEHELGAVPVLDMWRYTGLAGMYAVSYAVLALAVGMLMFQSRELGGGEG
jgi:ABC-type transport system involved in multi-copper enzyme maturation permease subunit